MSAYRPYVLLFVLALFIRIAAALPQRQPDYMDAAYSYDIALNLARGQGFVEPFLWNYLDDPAGIPHPSHLYWMPLPTILAWVGLSLLGPSYRAAQAPFVLTSALLPLVSYWVAMQITGSRRHAWLAGLLTLFSGFYVLYWGHTDNFTPFALAGSLSLAAAWRAGQGRESRLGAGGCPKGKLRSGLRAGGWAVAAGILAGLAHLSRADGPLLLIAIGIVNIKCQISNVKCQISSSVVRHPSFVIHHLSFDTYHLIFVILGYLLVMLPWFARNYVVAGTPLPAAGAQTMWLTTYDDLFSYGRVLSAQTYLAWGWGNILRSKLDALWLNAQTAIAVWGMVFLAPLAITGRWRLRRHGLVQLATWYGLLLFLAMTLVFTFPGPRGGLLHSGGALLPFIFSAAVVGLDALVDWAAARRRGWDAGLAKQVFGVGVVGLAVLVSGFLYYQRVIIGAQGGAGEPIYTRLVEWLRAEGQAEAVVMLGDPPGYWYHGGGPSVVAPNEPLERALEVADRYQARYLVLDRNRPAPLEPLYTGEVGHPRLALVYTLADERHKPVYVFQIIPAPD